MSLSGKTAVITGSNSGIGLGIATELAKSGANVILNSFTNRDEDHALAESLSRDHGITARYIAADLSDGAAARQLIADAGACDILVNNAGIQHVAPITEFPPEKWDQIISIMLNAPFHQHGDTLIHPIADDPAGGRAGMLGFLAHDASPALFAPSTVVRLKIPCSQ